MNTFGTNFRVSIFGESHNKYIGVCIDGCKEGIHLTSDDFKADLKKRQAEYKGGTKRREVDQPIIVSGVFNDYTTGMPITILFENNDTVPSDYFNLKRYPRPSHSDFAAQKKYNNYNDYRGGGSFSGRMTVALVAAGVVAKKTINNNIKISTKLIKVHDSTNIDAELETAFKKGDSIGGVVECRISNVGIGYGEPFFNSFESMLSHLIFSIPGVKGIEFGAGFEIAKMYGSEANDIIIDETGKTLTNCSGGINAGITNGNDIVFRTAFRPTPSISMTQKTIDLQTKEAVDLEIKGRHDVCFAVRTPIIVENCAAIVLADFGC